MIDCTKGILSALEARNGEVPTRLTLGGGTGDVGRVTWVTVALLPSEPGPYSERPFSKALLLGGVIALPVMAVDLIARPRRLWLWGLVAWGAILCASAWSGAFGDDSDIDQILGWGMVLGGLVGIPLMVTSAGVSIWRRVGRAVENRPRRWNVSVSETSLEVARKRDPDE